MKSNPKSKIFVSIFFIGLVISIISPITLAFTCDAIAICDEPNHQYDLSLCSDGEGGAYITWTDNRSGLGYDIYAQKVNVNGSLVWDLNGIPICTELGDQVSCGICSDGEGGAITVWLDHRIESEKNYYAQRINANGDLLWNVSGVGVSKRIGSWICSDNSGGAIIAGRFSDDLYAQRISSNGTVMWGSDGIVICNATDKQSLGKFFCDDDGNSFFTWEDNRKGEVAPGEPDIDIYAQKVNINGIVQWQPNGTEICTIDDIQMMPQICTDGFGGAIISWVDLRESMQFYAQRINSNGDPQWTSNGTVVANYTEPSGTAMCSDGEGGAIMAFMHVLGNLYANRINSNGIVLYSSLLYNAFALGRLPSNFRISSDGEAGAFITWVDLDGVYGYDTPLKRDIKAQQVDMNGKVFWSKKGKVVCDAPGDQWYVTICSNELGSAFIAWEDHGNENDWDIYIYLLEKVREKEIAIRFGNFYLIFTILAIMVLIEVSRRYVCQNPKV
ncbi:MAG: hypothetical protein ACFFG0_23840 [Candidatus Thorarchaeota archaeon]